MIFNFKIEADSNHQEKIQRSLSISITEGMAAAVMVGIIEYYAVPLGIFMGANPSQIGLLSSLPQLFGALALWFASSVVSTAGSRLRVIVNGALAQVGIIAAIATIAYLSTPGKITALILLMIAYRTLANIIGPAWGSLIAEYLKEDERGRYLGGRSKIAGIAQVASTSLAGTILFLSSSRNQALGFFTVFIICAIGRLISGAYLSQMLDMPHSPPPKSSGNLINLMGRFREDNFARFLWFVAVFVFTVSLAAPYFSVYMLRELKFNYLTYTAVMIGASLAGFISMPGWGRHSDVVGNARIIKISSILIPLSPFMWLISRNPFYVTVIEMLSGFAWGGFNLCATNFVYDTVEPGERVKGLAYFNLIVAVSIFTGAATGAWLLDKLPPILGSSIPTLMLISGILRLIAYSALAHTFHEERPITKHTSNIELFFSVAGIRSILPGPEERVP